MDKDMTTGRLTWDYNRKTTRTHSKAQSYGHPAVGGSKLWSYFSPPEGQNSPN